jgi:hypothetical protein
MSFPCLRARALQRAGVKTGNQRLKINSSGFLLEFIPMKIGAGMTSPKKTNLTFRNLKTPRKCKENCPFSPKMDLIWTVVIPPR